MYLRISEGSTYDFQQQPFYFKMAKTLFSSPEQMTCYLFWLKFFWSVTRRRRCCRKFSYSPELLSQFQANVISTKHSWGIQGVFFCCCCCGFSSHLRIFHSYENVTFAGEGQQILICARHSWPTAPPQRSILFSWRVMPFSQWKITAKIYWKHLKASESLPLLHHCRDPMESKASPRNIKI